MARKATPRKPSKAATKSRPAPRRRAARSGGAAESLGTRPIWTGQFRLSLVAVPVRLYPATKSGAQIAFHQIHEPSGKRIRYEKVVPGIGPIDTDDIVRGVKLDGRYVLLTDQELESVKLEAKKTFELVQFVEQRDIDPIWFDRPYYAVPDGDLAEEAYGVLRDSLRAMGRVGLGQLVVRGRESIAALKPCGKGLLLETLRFADEIRAAAPFFAAVDTGKADKELLALAQELIERKSAPFDPKRFKDQYTDALRAMITRKAKRKTPIAIDEEDEPRGGGAQVIDLVEALKRSVRGASESKGTTRRKAG